MGRPPKSVSLNVARLTKRHAVVHVESFLRALCERLNVMSVHAARCAMAAVLTLVPVSRFHGVGPLEILRRVTQLNRLSAEPLMVFLSGHVGARLTVKRRRDAKANDRWSFLPSQFGCALLLLLCGLLPAPSVPQRSLDYVRWRSTALQCITRALRTRHAAFCLRDAKAVLAGELRPSPVVALAKLNVCPADQPVPSRRPESNCSFLAASALTQSGRVRSRSKVLRTHDSPYILQHYARLSLVDLAA